MAEPKSNRKPTKKSVETDALQRDVLEKTVQLAEATNLQKKAQDELRASEEFLQKVLDLLPVGIWIADREGKITYGNPMAQWIWGGYRYIGIPEFSQYKGWWLDTGKRIESDEWALARAIRNGERSLNEEIEIECFDGSRKTILNSAIPIRNASGQMTGAIVINEDITERKEVEKVIRQMQKMEALGVLAGGIAHDLNNILMPIMINTDIALLDLPEGNPTREYLRMVQEAASRGKDLIKQIMAFSRQEERMKTPLDLGPIINEGLRLIRCSIPSNIEISQHISAPTALVLADATQMDQVLINLCSNAAQAMGIKGGVLDVRLTEVEIDSRSENRVLDLPTGSYVRMDVSDTGPGMDKKIMDRIFQPFFTTKRPGEGTGMGLSVVHGIVKEHGGAVTVSSEIGKGSTFSVFLPLLKPANQPSPAKPMRKRKEKILLIDDEELQIRSIRPVLEKFGFEVITMTDSIQSLELFKTRPDAFDLIITDETMPRMNGRELSQEFLRIRPDIPIIL